MPSNKLERYGHPIDGLLPPTVRRSSPTLEFTSAPFQLSQTMRKRTQIDYSVAKRYVGPTVNQTGPDSSFRVSGGGQVVDIPMTRDSMRRLFHLGYAFNLRQLKYLDFGASLIIGSVDVPDFQRNLWRIKKLVNDPETHAICDRVLEAFKDPLAEYVLGVQVAPR